MSRIVEPVSPEEFGRLLQQEIKLSSHALEHLSRGQRKLFKPKRLLEPLRRERPAGIGRQKNGRYAAYYCRQGGYLKIILEAQDGELEVVTFVNTRTMPNLKA